jgi:hypothetical protein
MESTNEILNEVMKDIGKGLNETLQGTYEKFEQDPTTRWTGKVIDNNDPIKLGRVKILIFGYYDDFATGAIPWAVPDISYVGGTNGNFVIPEVGTILRGYFDEGDIQKPIFDSVAFTVATATSMERNFFTGKIEDYPYKMVLMETDNGEYLTLNRRTGETVFKHRTGMMLTIDRNGSISVTTGEGIEGLGNIKINVKGNTEINTTGDTKITSTTGKVIIDSDANMVELGRNVAKQLVNNFPNCVICGVPHNVGNTNVWA